MNKKVNKSIFRMYDIRGNTLIDLTDDVAYKIGFCFTATNINDEKIICIGMDGRLSNYKLYKALTSGILDAGGKILNIGVVHTPLLYFVDKIINPQASIMITGSHNPKDDNGFKILLNGIPFYKKQLKILFSFIEKTPFPKDLNKNIKNHMIEYKDFELKYVEKILDNIVIDPNIKVIWDPANSSPSKIIKTLIKKLPNKNLIINSTIDGNFPKHHPDPSVLENCNELIQLVDKMNYDIGIALDGDGDRIAVITKNGKHIAGEKLLAIFAQDIIDRNPNAKIVVDIKTSESILNYIRNIGGIPIISKTGHPNIKAKLEETNALLGGEVSGHIFFLDKYYGYDDGVYAAIRVLELVTKKKQDLDVLLNSLPNTNKVSEKFAFVKDEEKFKIIKKIKNKLKKDKISFNDLDGIRVKLKNGWWLIRASNTEPKITLRYEVDNEKDIVILNKYLKSFLNINF